MPLTRKVTFRRMFQRGCRVQFPKIIIGEFKLEPGQVLKVGFSVPSKCKGWEFFYAKIGKDGCIFIPKLTQSLLQREKPILAGSIFVVTLEPT